METTIINQEKGYLWPVDILCKECEGNIHIESKDDLRRVTNRATGEVQYFCTCKCGESHRIHADQIPDEILATL